MTEMNPAPSEQADLDNALNTEGGSGNNRRLLYVLGGAAVLVAAAGGFFLLHSGGSGGNTGGSVVVAVNHNPSSKPSATPSPSDTATKPPVYNGQAGRNPFKPLAGEATPPAASPTATDTASAGTGTGTGATTPTTFQVTLKSASVSAQTATVWVNGTEYTDVAVGSTFAGVFRLDVVAKDSHGAYIQLSYGDVAEPGKLYVGHTMTGP
jgi:hypothetical protein